MSTKNPSEGQKVDLGYDAPVKTEAAGKVPSESLAAESYREGGTFRENVGSQPSENTSSFSSTSGSAELGSTGGQQQQQQRDSNYSESTSRSAGQPQSYAGTAPSYVENQYTRDQSGPYGRNITEGFSSEGAEDGLKKALESEPGSINDPSRLAEEQMQLNNEAKSAGAGPRQGEIDSETKYDALRSETSS